MGELGAAAGRAFAEIGLFDEGYIIAARSGVDGCADACGASADDENVPGFLALVETS